MGELPEVVRPADQDAQAIVDAERLSEDEALYARAARAANTVGLPLGLAGMDRLVCRSRISRAPG